MTPTELAHAATESPAGRSIHSRVKMNYGNADQVKLPPVGWYPIRVLDLETGTTKSGLEFIRLFLEISDGEWAGTKFQDDVYLTFNEGKEAFGMARHRAITVAAGLVSADDREPDYEIAEFQGKEFWTKIRIETRDMGAGFTESKIRMGFTDYRALHEMQLPSLAVAETMDFDTPAPVAAKPKATTAPAPPPATPPATAPQTSRSPAAIAQPAEEAEEIPWES